MHTLRQVAVFAVLVLLIVLYGRDVFEYVVGGFVSNK